MTLRVSDIYLTIQGEGPYTGNRTVFVEFATCLLCQQGNECSANNIKDLSKHRVLSVSELVKEINHETQNTPVHVCFSDIDHFEEDMEDLKELSEVLATEGYIIQELVTHGFTPLPEEVFDNLHILIAWRLSSYAPIVTNNQEKIRLDNCEFLSPGDSIKFYISDKADFNKAVNSYHQLVNLYEWDNTSPVVLLGPKFYYGVTYETLTDTELIYWVMNNKLPWIHSMQSTIN